MKNTIIDELNKVLTNTLDYREVLRKLASTISHNATQEKLKEFSEIAEKEGNRLIKAISDLGGDVESSDRQTDQEAICWITSPLPDTNNMQSVLACLIEAERKKEDDYSAIFAHDDIDRETRNRLDKNQRQTKANILYFQTAMQTSENKA